MFFGQPEGSELLFPGELSTWRTGHLPSTYMTFFLTLIQILYANCFNTHFFLKDTLRACVAYTGLFSIFTPCFNNNHISLHTHFSNPPFVDVLISLDEFLPIISFPPLSLSLSLSLFLSLSFFFSHSLTLSLSLSLARSLARFLSFISTS